MTNADKAQGLEALPSKHLQSTSWKGLCSVVHNVPIPHSRHLWAGRALLQCSQLVLLHSMHVSFATMNIRRDVQCGTMSLWAVTILLAWPSSPLLTGKLTPSHKPIGSMEKSFSTHAETLPSIM